MSINISNLTSFASILTYSGIYMCGSGSVFRIRIRIQEAPEYGSNTDLGPDPQHWFFSHPYPRPIRRFFLTFSPITSRSVLVTKMDELLQKYCANQFCTPFQCEETLYSWLLSMVSCWVWSDGYQLAESGDSLDRLVSVRAFETYCA